MPHPHETLLKFGYPDTVVHEGAHWAVMVRPAQATLGALVVACKEDARAFSAISAAAHAELKPTVERVETCLKKAFAWDKINWLALMMIDPQVHFHVLPRYAGERSFGGLTFADPGWPAAPVIGHAPALGPTTIADLTQHLRRLWAAYDAR